MASLLPPDFLALVSWDQQSVSDPGLSIWQSFLRNLVGNSAGNQAHAADPNHRKDTFLDQFMQVTS